MGEVLRDARIASGLTMLGLSDKLTALVGARVGPSYIAELESGRVKRPERRRLVALAAILGLPESELLLLADYSAGELIPELRDLEPSLRLSLSEIAKLSPHDQRIIARVIREEIERQKQSRQ